MQAPGKGKFRLKDIQTVSVCVCPYVRVNLYGRHREIKHGSYASNASNGAYGNPMAAECNGNSWGFLGRRTVFLTWQLPWVTQSQGHTVISPLAGGSWPLAVAVCSKGT